MTIDQAAKCSDFITYLVSQIVTAPDRVSTEQGPGDLCFSIKSAPEDRKLVIGSNGANIGSISTFANFFAARQVGEMNGIRIRLVGNENQFDDKLEFKPSNSWGTNDDHELITMFEQIHSMLFTGAHYAVESPSAIGKSILKVKTRMDIDQALLNAYETYFRAVGKSRGRLVVFQCQRAFV